MLVEKVELLKNALKKYLPRCRYELEEIGTEKYILRPLSLNHGLNRSQYFYRENLPIIHFTKLASLKSILTNKNLRLYNLNKMNDPIEFLFAARKLNLSEEEVMEAKSKVFCLSTCEETIMNKTNKTNQFNLWRLYGDNGFGVAIYLERVNQAIDWDNYHLGKVCYGIAPTDHMKQFRHFMTVLKESNKTLPEIKFDYGKFLCFHKSSIYVVEEEVRLLYDGRLAGEDSPVVVTEDAVKDVKFISMGLATGNGCAARTVPELKISKILIGYQYNDREYLKIKKSLSDLALKELGYAVEIKRSNLFANFWGKTFIAP